MGKFLETVFEYLTGTERKQTKRNSVYVPILCQNSPARCHQLWIIDQNISLTQPYREVCVVQHDSCESNHIKSIYSMADLIFEKSDKLAKEIVERKNVTFFYIDRFTAIVCRLCWNEDCISGDLCAVYFHFHSFRYGKTYLAAFVPYIGISISTNFFFLFRFYSTKVLRVGLDFKRKKKKSKGNRRTTELY